MQRLLMILTLALVATSGCKQGIGERCQVNSDCDDELICCVGEEMRSSGGTCQREKECELPTADAGVDSGEDDGEVKEDSKPDTSTDAPKEATVPDTAPDTAPDMAPDMAPDTAPDTTPDLEPDTIDGDASTD